MPRHKFPYHDATADDTATLIKTGGTWLSKISASQVDAADNFIQLFNAAAAADVNLGTTVPVYTVFVPAGACCLRGAVAESFPNCGMYFDKGLVYAVTTTAGGCCAPCTALPLNAVYS